DVRIGTYDSRAVAVAYARSGEFTARSKDLQRQRTDAEKAGEDARVAELETIGQSMQTRLHLQGFSTAPVDDILQIVADKLPGVAQQNHLAIITRAAEYHVEGVTLVDVTNDLVALFNPDTQTLKIVNDLRAQKPLPIEQVASMPANE